MALCDKPCCNSEAAARVKAERQAEFQAFLDARKQRPEAVPMPVITVADAPEGNDITYAEALARAGVHR